MIGHFSELIGFVKLFSLFYCLLFHLQPEIAFRFQNLFFSCPVTYLLSVLFFLIKICCLTGHLGYINCRCGYALTSAGTFANGTTSSSNPDCLKYSNDASVRCYDCDSCKYVHFPMATICSVVVSHLKKSL